AKCPSLGDHNCIAPSDDDYCIHQKLDYNDAIYQQGFLVPDNECEVNTEQKLTKCIPYEE
ncbi:hypothetical protein J6590_089274, partial [Homalodisca vitripennis]